MPIAAYPAMQRLVTKLNSLVFVGEPLGSLAESGRAMLTIWLAGDSEYLRAALQFPMDVFVTSEVIHSLPSFLSRYGTFLTPLCSNTYLTATKTSLLFDDKR